MKILSMKWKFDENFFDVSGFDEIYFDQMGEIRCIFGILHPLFRIFSWIKKIQYYFYSFGVKIRSKSTRLSSIWIFKESKSFNFSGVSLNFCGIPGSGSCCTTEIEAKLVNHAKSQIEKYTKESLHKLTTVLKTRTIKFNGNYELYILQKKFGTRMVLKSFFEYWI